MIKPGKQQVQMQKLFLASLTVIGLLPVPPAFAGGGISLFSGLMGGIVGGSQDSLAPPKPHPVPPRTQEVPQPSSNRLQP